MFHRPEQRATVQPEAARILSQVKFDTDTIANMTFAHVVEKQDLAEFAKKQVADNGTKIDVWLK